MLISVILFWISLSILFFCYLGYGLIIFIVNGGKRLFQGTTAQNPVVEYLPLTLVVTAYNEGVILEEKIKNTLAIDYPPDKLRVIFVTDGSTDGSENIVKKYPSIHLLHQSKRQGKLAAIKRAVGETTTPLLVFSDANAMLNRESLRRIATHYRDPRTGGVAGEKRIMDDKQQSALGDAEGLYWSYESFLKKQDADFNTVVGAAGELYSIRTQLFPQIREGIILDDFVISMKVCLQGYRIRYEPGAFASELPSESLHEEKKRKTRIAAGAYQSIGYLGGALNLFRYPLLSFQYIVRRLCRWILCPLLLLLLLVSNIFIVTGAGVPVLYTVLLAAQITFYLSAIAGGLIIASGRRAGLLTIPFYFVFMNYCLLTGFARFVRGKQDILWEKSVRQTGY